MDVYRFLPEENSREVAVKSDIVKAAEEAQIEAFKDLLINLRRMVNKPALSDVVFLCNDGIRVHGSRIHLSGMSEMLDRMLNNGMVESGQSEITLPDISSPVLLSVFEFLYTGALVDYPPQIWRTACELIIASRFFLLPYLEKITRKFMNDQIVSVADELPEAASMLTEAVSYKTIRDGNDISLKDLVAILNSDWSDDFANLSEDAFQYLLTNTKCYEGDGHGAQSMAEYLRFRQVIRWWISQAEVDSLTAEELVPLIAPDEDNALAICQGRKKFTSSCGDSACLFLDARHSDAWTSVQCNIRSRDSVWKLLLASINFQQIPSVLLMKVVEPLGLVCSTEISNAFRYHALQRHFIFKPDCDYEWDHGKFYTELEQGHVVRKKGSGIGLAIALHDFGRRNPFHQWSFEIKDSSKSSCEVGFLMYPDEGTIACDGERLSDQRGARVLRSEGDEVSVNYADGGGRCDWKSLGNAFSEGTTVLFSFDMSQRTCSVDIGSSRYRDLWANLRKATYYPAVCLGKGRVRMILGTGFDYN